MRVPWLLGVMGPTASGKTFLAEHLADVTGARLINSDAFQVYRGFDIGTAKSDRRDLYHLLDIKAPNEGYGVGEFMVDALALLQAAWEEGRPIIVVGGTGLYMRALFEEYSDLQASPPAELRLDLERREKEEGLASLVAELRALRPDLELDWKNPVRVRRALERTLAPAPVRSAALPPFKKLKVALDPETNWLNEKIDDRYHRMIEEGWLQEVQKLTAQGVLESAPAMRAIGYLALRRVAMGETTLEETGPGIRAQMRQYAKRQRTWLRSEPHLLRLPSEISSADGLSANQDIILRTLEH